MNAMMSKFDASIRQVLLACAAAVLAVAVVPAATANDQVRVSVKIVLDEDGDTPSGDFNTVDEVKQAISEANSAAQWGSLCWRIHLVQVGSVAGISDYFVIDSNAEKLQLEEDAIADPGRFAWRFDAINIYIVDNIDTSGSPGGSCSFPVSGDGDTFEVIVIESGISNGGVGWLHEIGHYLSLVHTFECYAPPGSDCDEDVCQGEGAFFALGGTTIKKPCPDVCPDDFNVMSYNSLAQQDARFSDCQREAMNFQLFETEAGGQRGSVVERQPLRVAKIGQPYPSIRQGILAACPGGTVEILPDTYAETTPFPKKWVVLKALRGTVVVTPP